MTYVPPAGGDVGLVYSTVYGPVALAVAAVAVLVVAVAAVLVLGPVGV